MRETQNKPEREATSQERARERISERGRTRERTSTLEGGTQQQNESEREATTCEAGDKQDERDRSNE